jgi:hypothetical protein
MDLFEGLRRQLGVSVKKDENLSSGYGSPDIHLFGSSSFGGDLDHMVPGNGSQSILFLSSVHHDDLTIPVRIQAIQTFNQVINVFPFVKCGHNN